MAHDRTAKKKAKEDCPECGSDALGRKKIERIPGGIDWEKVYCRECDYSQRY